MIVFELICGARHRFEGWFASGEDFNAQKGRRLIACPQCGDGDVEKLPTARVRTGEAADPGLPVPAVRKGPQTAGRNGPQTLGELIDHVLMNTEDVGNRFADEARRIHRDEAPKRDIRGTATGEEARTLIEEGIAVLPLPIPPKGEWQ
jgi:hypothetical protein